MTHIYCCEVVQSLGFFLSPPEGSIFTSKHLSTKVVLNLLGDDNTAQIWLDGRNISAILLSNELRCNPSQLRVKKKCHFQG